jgi:hypothetical protein
MKNGTETDDDQLLNAAEIGMLVGALQQRRHPRKGTDHVVSDVEAAARVGQDLIQNGKIRGAVSRGRYCASRSEVEKYLARCDRHMRQQTIPPKRASGAATAPLPVELTVLQALLPEIVSRGVVTQAITLLLSLVTQAIAGEDNTSRSDAAAGSDQRRPGEKLPVSQDRGELCKIV